MYWNRKWRAQKFTRSLDYPMSIRGNAVNALPNLREAGQLAEGDELILDMVNSGFEACSVPTATPDEASPDESEATEQP